MAECQQGLQGTEKAVSSMELDLWNGGNKTSSRLDVLEDTAVEKQLKCLGSVWL